MRMAQGALAEVCAATSDDLLELADAVEHHDGGALDLLQTAIVESTDFISREPNYGHLAVALLLSEDLVGSITVNWDTCIEKVSGSSYGAVVACRTRDEVLGARGTARLLKPHGSAELETSLLISTAQMEGVPWWAAQSIASSLANNRVIFIGLGDVPPYVQRTLEQVLERASNRVDVRVVAPELPAKWQEFMRPYVGDSQDWFVSGTSEEKLDELLRSLMANSMATVTALVNSQFPHVGGYDHPTVSDEAIALLRDTPVHLLWLWLRRGAFPLRRGRLASGQVMEKAILAMALLHAVSPIQSIDWKGSCVTIRTTRFLLEIAVAADVIMGQELAKLKRESLYARKNENLFPSDGSVVVLAHGMTGPLPSPNMPEYIVDDMNVDSVIDGAVTLNDTWLDINSLLQASSLDAVEDLLGTQI